MRGLACAALVLLAGCEKSFEDRYADAEKKIARQAASIDKDLAAKASEAAAAQEPAEGGASVDETPARVAPSGR
jgi:hypothetical protein